MWLPRAYERSLSIRYFKFAMLSSRLTAGNRAHSLFVLLITITHFKKALQ